MKVNTSDIVAALRHCSTLGGSGCEACVFANDPSVEWPLCGDVLCSEAALNNITIAKRCSYHVTKLFKVLYVYL